MKKFILTISLTLAVASLLQAQTKLIAHRSHSGSDLTFSLDGDDNLGQISIKYTKEEYEEMNKKYLEEEKKRVEEQKRLEAETKKKEEEKLLAEKKKKEEEEERLKKEREAVKIIYTKDSIARVQKAKVIKDTVARPHKRQYYSPYGLPVNKSPKPEAAVNTINTRKAGFDFSGIWVLILAGAALLLIKK